jgi:hypothetical protein
MRIYIYIFLSFQDVLKACNSVRKSLKAQHDLYQKHGKSLVGLSATRWGSIYLVVQRLKELWTSFVSVCKEYNIAMFAERHRKFIFELEILLKPFYVFLVDLQGETYVTLSKVYTKIKEVLYHVEHTTVSA